MDGSLPFHLGIFPYHPLFLDKSNSRFGYAILNERG